MSKSIPSGSPLQPWCQQCIATYTQTQAHPLYKGLCQGCGNDVLATRFNFQKNESSQRLEGKNFLVFGASHAIGFHLALKFLRLGAMVVAQLNPKDMKTLAQFHQEADYATWAKRLVF